MRDNLFDEVEEVLAGDLTSHNIVQAACKSFSNTGKAFADKATDQIRIQVLRCLKQIAAQRGAQFSEEDLEESDAYYDLFHVFAREVLEGMNDAWPFPVTD